MLYRFVCVALSTVMAAALLSGCSDQTVPDPPIARAELTARLFDALQFQRYSDALAIIDKLLAIAPDDVELMEMRDRIVANGCTINAQAHIDYGRLDEALKIVTAERKKYPMLPQLLALEEEIRSLIALRDAANALAAAQTLSELAAALENITPLAAKYPQATALQNDIASRRNDLKRLREEANRTGENAVNGTTAPAAPPSR